MDDNDYNTLQCDAPTFSYVESNLETQEMSKLKLAHIIQGMNSARTNRSQLLVFELMSFAGMDCHGIKNDDVSDR